MKESVAELEYEERTRLNLFLPINNRREAQAVDEIFEHLKRKHRVKGKIVIKGFTHSSPYPTAFSGYWWSSNKRRWIKDKILLVIIDHWLTFFANDQELDKEVAELRDKVIETYKKYGSEQESLWITAYQVRRYD